MLGARLLSARLLSACASGPTNDEGVSGGLRSYAGGLQPPQGYKNVGLTCPADGPRLLEGRQVFAATCAVCHGPELRGRGLSGVNILLHPADLRAPRIANLTDGEVLGDVAEGVPGTGMPAWKLLLTRPQMEAVALYVRSRMLIVPEDTRTNAPPGTPPQIVLGRQNYRRPARPATAPMPVA